MQSKQYRIFETIIYAVFWLLVFSVPVLLSQNKQGINWLRIQHEWIRILPFIVIFFINNHLLFRFFYRKKYVKYFLFTTIAILLVTALALENFFLFHVLDIPRPESAPIGNIGSERFTFNRIFYHVVFCVLIVGLNNAVKITLHWIEKSRNYDELQKESLKTELAFLRHQVSPHFFMNTLNNIYALIDYNREVAKHAVVKLSKLMRVLLDSNTSNHFTLQREIDFLNDYIELMRIRVNTNVEITLKYPDTIPDVQLPPLLFISFVENAFKHGIKAIGKSFIHIEFRIENRLLQVKIANSKAQKADNSEKREKIGLNNSAKRLNLLYRNQHSLNIIEDETTFEVHIKIPIQ